MEIHPDDILTFHEVTKAMRKLATEYNLPLKSVSGLPMPKTGMADRMGECTNDGHIRLVLRCTVNGKWCDEPMSPEEIWDTAAHELAHLRHFNHGLQFQEFEDELKLAMENRKANHRKKILDKLVKLQRQLHSEAAIGNAEAAEAFAGMINKMLIEYELNPSDIDYATAADHDPVVELFYRPASYGAKSAKTRVAWQEHLGSVVAQAHLCKILISPGSNMLVFVGTKSHATVAEYVYGTMVPLIERMSKAAEVVYWRQTGSGRGADNKAKGYRSAWINGFIKRIFERFDDARKAAVAASVRTGGSETMAMVRLNGSLVKVRKYIDDKFDGKKNVASHLNGGYRNHKDGLVAGRAAADQITLGRRGVTEGASRKLLE